MAIIAIPIIINYENDPVSDTLVPNGDGMMSMVEAEHNYSTAVYGERFKSDEYEDDFDGHWIPPEPFKATLKILYKTYENNKVIVIDESINRRYDIFMNDFFTITQTLDIIDGAFTGNFEYVKKGRSFGIQLIQE